MKDSVLASTYFPVRASVGDIYADNAIMSEYTKFMAYLATTTRSLRAGQLPAPSGGTCSSV